jgi:hypothetical protein
MYTPFQENANCSWLDSINGIEEKFLARCMETSEAPFLALTYQEH